MRYKHAPNAWILFLINILFDQNCRFTQNCQNCSRRVNKTRGSARVFACGGGGGGECPRYCCASKNAAPALKNSLSGWGGGGGGTPTQPPPPPRLQIVFLSKKYHNGVGVLSSWTWLTAELTSKKKKKKKKSCPPPPWPRAWVRLTFLDSAHLCVHQNRLLQYSPSKYCDENHIFEKQINNLQ